MGELACPRPKHVSCGWEHPDNASVLPAGCVHRILWLCSMPHQRSLAVREVSIAASQWLSMRPDHASRNDTVLLLGCFDVPCVACNMFECALFGFGMEYCPLGDCTAQYSPVATLCA